MKLIIREYLASLKERGELDVILPDLLSQMKFDVFSRPSIGSRQSGVDVAATKKINGEERVYLFSIKAGDITRNSWDGTNQSLRPSLNEIIDDYIPNRLTENQRKKKIIICLCFGGDIHENTRTQVTGYIERNKKDNLFFEEWNGDKLASYIEKNFINEELLPDGARQKLRKALAFIDEPEVSYKNYKELMFLFSDHSYDNDKKIITAIRQCCICLWILYSWSRDQGNLESAYLSSELTVLHAWDMAKPYFGKNTKNSKLVLKVIDSIIITHQKISFSFIDEKIIPHANKTHALSVAVQSQTAIDVNLKLFDILGRISMVGIWNYWGIQRIKDDNDDIKEAMWDEVEKYCIAIKNLIRNNPILLMPLKDEQVIDINMAIFLLLIDNQNHEFLNNWLNEMFNRIDFSFKTLGKYPCCINNYADLIEHPKEEDEYLAKSTSGSVLYPFIACCAAILHNDKLFNLIKKITSEHLEHCTFQVWYPDDSSENHFYKNTDIHGVTLAGVDMMKPSIDMLDFVLLECGNSDYFENLSAVKASMWPLILVACRNYRLPIPFQLMKGFCSES